MPPNLPALLFIVVVLVALARRHHERVAERFPSWRRKHDFCGGGIRWGDREQRCGVSAPNQDIDDDIGGVDTLAQRLQTSASTAGRPSLSTVVRMLTIWRSPSATSASLRRTRSSAAGRIQSLNGAPFLSAPGLRARPSTRARKRERHEQAFDPTSEQCRMLRATAVYASPGRIPLRRSAGSA